MMSKFTAELQHISQNYPSDFTDEQWALIAPWFDPPPAASGHPVEIPRRAIVQAIL